MIKVLACWFGYATVLWAELAARGHLDPAATGTPAAPPNAAIGRPVLRQLCSQPPLERPQPQAGVEIVR